jgi:hypothetical protein
MQQYLSNVNNITSIYLMSLLLPLGQVTYAITTNYSVSRTSARTNP